MKRIILILINKIYSFICKNLYSLILLLFLIPFNTTIYANNIKNSAVVYMYHRFDESKYPSTNITLDQFLEHLELFNSHEYNVLPLEFIIDSIITETTLPENTVAISIDDGHKSILKKAWPLIKKYGYPVTIFISTEPIDAQFSNYLTWDEIRLLKQEGADIGAHTRTHQHMHNLTTLEIKNEIEYSNKRFLKEIGEVPKLFAYPFGEANQNVVETVKDYGFKASFGQHSGVINETSDFNYLPRFSLNEKYGDIERVKFSSKTKGMGVYDLVPKDQEFSENPPFIGLSLLDENLSSSLNCFIFDSNGNINADMYKFEERIEIRLKRKLKSGRVRMNCTAKGIDGFWRWFGHQFIMPKYLDE